uniref:Uncharacterized protein n=1 Tax=Cucumis melo TaxID=3656 RepID=A0A9I9E411_CUCME
PPPPRTRAAKHPLSVQQRSRAAVETEPSPSFQPRRKNRPSRSAQPSIR